MRQNDIQLWRTKIFLLAIGLKMFQNDFELLLRTGSFESEEIVPFRKTAVLHFWP